MRYTHQTVKISETRFATRYFADNEVVTCAQFGSLLATDREFRQLVNQSVTDIPLDALFFESREVTPTSEDPFFWVAVQTGFSESCAVAGPFAKYFNGADRVVSFPSLSKTTQLVCPDAFHRDNVTNGVHSNVLLHLKAFCQGGNSKTVDDFWRLIGETSRNWQGRHWLKTHGHAVNYLHFRIQLDTSLYSTLELSTNTTCNQFYKAIKWG